MQIKKLDHVVENANFYVYNLSCPDTKKVKYIGISKNPTLRLKKHLSERSITLKNNWIKSLIKNGKTPVMTLIDYSETRNLACKKEKYWIIKYNEWGCELKNMTDGGDGGETFLGKKHTTESKNKISIANSGIKKPFLSIINVKNKSRKVAQIDFNSKEVIKIYDSVTKASEITGCSKTNISKFANGNIKSTIKKVGGYEWKYID